MKLLCWNVNALAPTVRNAVLKYGSWLGFFQEHGIDILALQEAKVLDEKLTKEMVCVAEEWQSFWAISKLKKGYSGVTTYASPAYAPLSCEVNCLGPGAEVDDEEGEDLNQEGRLVITDHQHFVLVNVYVPNAGDAPERARLPYKLRFLRALKRKCDELTAGGREVLIVGDFNVPAEPRDLHPSLGAYYDVYSQEEQAALRALTDSYTEVWRHLHPDESSTYTVWNEKTSARAFNQGLRIDYVLCTPGLLGKVVSCEVLTAEVLPPKWSDHAGIMLELRGVPPLPAHPPCQHWLRLHRRFNPPNLIVNLFGAVGKKKRQAAGTDPAAVPAAAAAAAGGGGSGGSQAAAGQVGAGGEQAAGKGGSGAGPAAEQGGRQQKRARGEEQPVAVEGVAVEAAREQGSASQQKPAPAAAHEQQQQQQQPQQQPKGGGGKQGRPGSGKQKAGKQQPQPPSGGQRTIASFFGGSKL